MSLIGYNWAKNSGRIGLAASIMRRSNLVRNRFYRGPSNRTRNMSRARQTSARSATFSRTRSRKKHTTSGIGVTEQHDARLIYQKRPMPRYLKRRWKAFRGKVLAVAEKDLGTQQVLFNATYTFTNTTAGNQCLAYALLYSLSSTSSGANDLNNISGFIAGAADTVSTGLAAGPSSKVLFQSGIMDITIRNGSLNNGQFDSSARMEVDIYECTQSRTAEETGGAYSDPLTLFAQNSVRTEPIGGGATSEINLTTRGATPFDLSYVLSRFGVKIWRKTKYQIANNDQITYQVRDPRRHSITQRELTSADGFNKPGLTRFIVIVGKIAPSLTVGPLGTANVYQEILNVGMSRKYTFKVENWSEDRTAYLNV